MDNNVEIQSGGSALYNGDVIIAKCGPFVTLTLTFVFDVKLKFSKNLYHYSCMPPPWGQKRVEEYAKKMKMGKSMSSVKN